MIIVVIIILLVAIAVLVAYNIHIQKKIEAFNNINQQINNLSVLQDFMKVAGEEDSVDAKINKINDIVTCKVAKFVSFGAFLEIEKGLEGLVHNSEITSLKRVVKPP